MPCSFFAVDLSRFKRQATEEEEALERQLCEDKGAGEWFRLETGQDKCRDVIQCTASVRMLLFSSRHFLAFPNKFGNSATFMKVQLAHTSYNIKIVGSQGICHMLLRR